MNLRQYKSMDRRKCKNFISIALILLLGFFDNICESKKSTTATAVVDYSLLVKWEKRTLICVDNRQSNSICQLALNSSRKSIATSCFDQKIVNNTTTTTNVRSYCRLQCANADRDSVITKIPHWRHKCIRYYTYDSERRDNEWFIWRSDSCRNESVTFEIHCGFPIT